jgi:hypothetical protein
MRPQGVAVTSTNEILVADQLNRGVMLFSADGKFIQNVISTESVPWGLCVKDNCMAVATHQGMQVYILNN